MLCSSDLSGFMPSMIFDLHCHSNYSDGLLTPTELLKKAEQNGVHYLSVTDHDTLASYQELEQINSTVSLIKGIELSTRWKKYDIHILGYQLQPNESFHQLIQQQNEARIERAKVIANTLESLGLKDAYSKTCLLAGHKRIGRPHIAQVLVQEGWAADIQTAFKRYLGKGKVAYVPTPWISVTEAVEGITSCGGQAVIAHPLKYGLTRTKLHELINLLKRLAV